MRHDEDHPLTGKKVLLNETTQDTARQMVVPGRVFEVENYWDRIRGGMGDPGMTLADLAESNFAAMWWSVRFIHREPGVAQALALLQKADTNLAMEALKGHLEQEIDDFENAVYGHIIETDEHGHESRLGHMVHVTELGEEIHE